MYESCKTFCWHSTPLQPDLGDLRWILKSTKKNTKNVTYSPVSIATRLLKKDTILVLHTDETVQLDDYQKFKILISERKISKIRYTAIAFHVYATLIVSLVGSIVRLQNKIKSLQYFNTDIKSYPIRLIKYSRFFPRIGCTVLEYSFRLTFNRWSITINFYFYCPFDVLDTGSYLARSRKVIIV